MKNIHIISVFLWILAFPKYVLSQNEPITPCATKSPTLSEYNFIKYHIANLHLPEYSSFTWIPIKVHVVQDGTGNGGIMQSDINKGIANLNHYFLEADIGFYVCGESPNIINNATFYDFHESEEDDLATGNEVSNSVNLFFVNSITSNDGNSNCGYAYLATNTDALKTTRIMMSNDCVLNAPNGTLVHEFGHFFSLLHTHEGTESGNNSPNAENVERVGPNKNCNDKGDFLCDTEADPRHDSDLFDLSNCTYIGSEIDAFGVLYTPPIDNIMSYYPDPCGGIFTYNQYEQIRQGLIIRKGHTSNSLDCSYTNVVNPNNLTAIKQNGNVALNWEDKSNNEFGFIIERSSQSGNSGFKALKNGGVAPNTTSFLDTEVIPNVNYWYRVRASNGGGDEYSNIASISNPTGQITYLEYYIDSDPGYLQGNEVAIIPSDNFELDVTVNLSNLNPGIHNLYFRCKNDMEEWSFTQKHTFFLIPALTTSNIFELEYFIDNDPGYGLGAAISITPGLDITEAFSVNLSNLSPGIHNLYIRAKNEFGQWSFVRKHTFFVIPAEANARVIAMEYFIDEDPGIGIGISIPVNPGGDIQNTFEIDISDLIPGVHNLYVRAKNEFGQWGFTRIHTFFVNYPLPEYEITEIEYFIDPDPGIGNGISFPIAPAVNDVALNFDIDLGSGLQSGEHILCVRAKNASGIWSEIECDTFQIISIISALFDVDHTSICLGEDITFKNNSVNADSFLWNFGNGEISSEFEPSHVYDFPGTYDVTLIATNTSNQNSDTLVLVDFITVYQNPIVNIIGDEKSCEEPIVLDAGSGFMNYTWSDNSQEPVFTATTTGIYAVTVSNHNGCTSSDELSVEIFSNPQPNIVGDENFCFGSSSILDAGNDFVSYHWSDGSSNQTLEVDNEASFSVTVTDINGCSGSDEITTFVHSLPTASIQPQDTTICEGQMLDIVAFGGVNYLWSNNGTEPAITISDEGIYSVTVTDINGCEDNASINLGLEPSPSIVDFTIGDANCGQEGHILVITQDPLDQFIWNNGFSGNEITSLMPGEYSVTITNSFGCSLEQSFEVTGTNMLELEFEIINVSCNGADDGMVVVNPNGGTPPYTYIWTPAPNTQQIDNLEPGSYAISVFDCCGCAANDLIEITEPDLLALNLVTTGDSASVSPEGGTPPYEVVWSNGETGLSVSGLNSGMYFVTVTDANGCVESDKFTDVKNIPSLTSFEIFPNPTNKFLYFNASFLQKQKGEINIYNLFGQKVKTTTFNSPIIQLEFDLSRVPSGTYLFEMIAEDGRLFEKVLVVD